MQNYLLDTHSLLRFLNGSNELSSRSREIIESNSTTNFISIASIWEIAIKISLRKLELTAPFSLMKKQIEENGFEILPITFEVTFTVAGLPFFHRDPFDRVIIAQAITNKLTVISKDLKFKKYEIKTIW